MYIYQIQKLEDRRLDKSSFDI